jgi:carbon storage regulator CsrA
MEDQRRSSAPALISDVLFVSTGYSSRLVIELVDGRALALPLDSYPTLKGAPESVRSDWRLIGHGQGVRWPTLDLDLSVAGILSTSTEELGDRRSYSEENRSPRAERAAWVHRLWRPAPISAAELESSPSLVFTRRVGDAILIGDPNYLIARISPLSIRDDRVRIGVQTDRGTNVMRSEVFDEISRNERPDDEGELGVGVLR